MVKAKQRKIARLISKVALIRQEELIPSIAQSRYILGTRPVAIILYGNPLPSVET